MFFNRGHLFVLNTFLCFFFLNWKNRTRFNLCCMARLWLKGEVGGKPPFVSSKRLQIARGFMALEFDESFSPGGSLFGQHVGDFDFDNHSLASGSAVPSVSHVLTDDVDKKEAVGDKVDFEHAVGAAWNSLATEQVEPVWNTGFWKCIFGNDTLGDALQQQFKRPMPVGDLAGEEPGELDKRQKISELSVDVPLFQSCVKSTDDLSWPEKRDALLQKALKHWLVLALSWKQEIEFVLCLHGCDSTNSQLIMLGDVFRGKAPSTLSKRANSMQLLCKMLGDFGLSFPCEESALYRVLCDLRSGGAPPSRGKGILEAIALVRYTMGILECDPLLKGRRCWGAATSDEPVSRTQASPLQVEELEKLHYLLEHDADKWNRLFCGTVLFMVYARARWSDAQHAVKILFDRDGGDLHYVEVLTGHHKTMRALQHRHQFLPLIAPAVGVTNQNWAALWEAVRTELGVNMELGCPLLPSPLETGALGRRALDSQEAGKWLRALLKLSPEAVADRKISSHSLKCTMLSFLAKRGVDMTDRLLLGYHTSPFKMGLTYSRDGMARLLIILNGMLAEIRSGTFKPDCTRSGRLVKPTQSSASKTLETKQTDVVKVEASDEESETGEWSVISHEMQLESNPVESRPELPEVVPIDAELEVNDACTETSSSDMSSDETAEPVFEQKGRRTFEPPVAPEGCKLWQHTKSKILHLVDDRFPHVFECGRKPGAFHTSTGVNPRWDTGICWKCFKHK